MAEGIRISELPASGSPQAADIFEVERSGGSYKVSFSQLADALESYLGLDGLADALGSIVGG